MRRRTSHAIRPVRRAVLLLAEHPTRRASLGIAAAVTVGAVIAGFTGGVSNLAAL